MPPDAEFVPWSEELAPLIARFRLAGVLGMEAHVNAEGSLQLSVILQEMAAKLDAFAQEP